MESSEPSSLDRHKSSSSKLRLIERAFVWMLRELRYGRLQIIFPSGACELVGEYDEPVVELRVKDDRFFKTVIAGGSVGFGEAYVSDYWDTSNLSQLLLLLARNQKDIGNLRRGFSLITNLINRFHHNARRNTIEHSKENVQAHYDLSNEFYKTFLDQTMTYSSALFSEHCESLEQAQINKIERMLDLACVGEGDSILEIGSGWGALALRAAKRGCRVKTITLSEKQYAFSKALFEHERVDDKVEIVLEDYRIQEGQYDAVLSCEMIEAVGREYLDSYFRIISRSLRSKGRAVIQAITIPDDRYNSYSRSCDWIQKHIFPGGHLPSPTAIYKHVANAGGTQVLSMHRFGSDYARTLRYWAQAFNREESLVESLGFDASFRRKWNYYLSYCEAGFDAGLIDVQHVEILKS